MQTLTKLEREIIAWNLFERTVRAAYMPLADARIPAKRDKYDAKISAAAQLLHETRLQINPNYEKQHAAQAAAYRAAQAAS